MAASKLNIADITPGTYFSAPVYLDNGFVLASPETPLSVGLLHLLDKWEFRELWSDGEAQKDRGEDIDEGRLEKAEEFFQELEAYVEQLFMQTAIGVEINFAGLAKKIKDVCAVIKDERRFLLAVRGTENKNQEKKDFIAAHTVRSTFLSIVIGDYLKLPSDRLIGLGIAALLHEIGMTKIPRHIYNVQRELSPVERMNILTHPVTGYNILKANRFPPEIGTAVLQHHERENGSGYPQMISGDRISLYARIIAVACSYEALTANRPHKDAKNGHAGILDLLRNEGKAYDDTVIRALVYSLSIYPIGTFVLLSSGKKAQVVDVNPGDPRFPIVKISGNDDPDNGAAVETSASGVKILRALTEEEIAALN
ncbi:phosphohydrolase [Spirochaetia bacterium]|nr:phosphohydrolase [Spirochaetia bacterium]